MTAEARDETPTGIQQESHRPIVVADDAHACLEAEAIAREVEQWLGHPSEGDLTIVLRGDEGFGFDILRGQRELGRRRFVDEGQACTQVVQIVGLAVAMAIEDQMSEVIAPILEAPPTAPSSPPPAQPAKVERDQSQDRGLGIGPVLGLSSLPDWGLDLGVSSWWRGPVSIRSELTLGYRPAIFLRDAASGSSSRALMLEVVAALAPCLGSSIGPGELSLVACLGLRGGPSFARGVDLEPNRWALSATLAATSGLSLGIPRARVRYEIGADLLVSLVEPSLRTQTPDGATAQTWAGTRIGGRLSLGVMFALGGQRRRSDRLSEGPTVRGQ